MTAIREVMDWSHNQGSTQPRSLFTVAFGPAGLILGLVAAVCLVTLVSVNSELQGVFGAVALTWLAVHQVPISLVDISLGALPVTPTVLLMGVVARMSFQAAKTRSTRQELKQVLAAAMGGPLLVTVILIAVAKDAATVEPLNAPAPAPALAWVTGIHILSSATGIGVAHRAQFLSRIPVWKIQAVRHGTAGALWICVTSGIIIMMNMLGHVTTLHHGFAAGSNVIGYLGILVVSLLYLPNLFISGIDVLLGLTVELGGATMSLPHAESGAVPLLPIFTTLPTWNVGNLGYLALIIPLTVGVQIGRKCCSRDHSMRQSMQQAMIATGTFTLIITVFSLTISGQVGAIGRWSVNVALLACSGFLVSTIPALLAVFFIRSVTTRSKNVPRSVVISPARQQVQWPTSDTDSTDTAESETEDSDREGSDTAPEDTLPAAEESTSDEKATEPGLATTTKNSQRAVNLTEESCSEKATTHSNGESDTGTEKKDTGEV